MNGLVAPGSATETQRRIKVRMRVVAGCFALAFLSIGIRLVDMASGGLPDLGASHAVASEGTDFSRAAITDRNGVLMASNMITLSVIADPAKVIDPEATASALAAALPGVNEIALARRLQGKGRFVWVKRQISPQEQAAVQDLGLPGVGFDFSERRVYPRRSVAGHVLGFVDIDNNGLAGIEFGMNDRLKGSGEAEADALPLSLDLRVQQIAENFTGAAVRRFRAIGACTLVMDIRTREVLALVSLPDFDPNHPDRAGPERRRNRCSGSVYELGSLFKIVTTAMALDSGEVTLYDRFDASQPLRIGRNRINDDHSKKRWLTTPEVFAFSSNIGTAQMAFMAGGAERQQSFLKSLGLFEPSRLEIPEVERPLLPRRWIDIVSATVSYGHGIAVSPLQFVTAVASILGDGRAVPPTLIRREPDEVEGPKVVSDQTVRDMRWLTWLTVEHGTGSEAARPGYLIGGKTGTADKPSKNRRGYGGDAVIASFIGVFPVDKPRYVVLTTLDEPHGDKGTHGYRYGGWTAAPVVGDIIERIGPLLGVPPSRPEDRASLESRLRIVPALNGRTHRMEDGFAALGPAR